MSFSQIIKRILWVIPSLMAVLLIGFFMEYAWPINPVDQRVNQALYSGGSAQNESQIRARIERELGYDKPAFYLGLHLKSEHDFFPEFNWNGTSNRFHTWVFGASGKGGLIRGDFGKSFDDGVSVWTKVAEKWKLSFWLCGVSLVLAFGLTIAVSKPIFFAQGMWKKIIDNSLYFLYACPAFLGGLALLYFFANRSVLYWFPSGGWQPLGESQSWFENIPYLVLPALTFTYGSLAFLVHVHQAKIKEEWEKEYVRSASAKGLSTNQVYWNQVFKNSLFPLITAFGQSLPILIGGSVIVEALFSIPGIGFLTYKAVLNADFPMINAIFILSSIFTLLGYLVSDILYGIADPRIKHQVHEVEA